MKQRSQYLLDNETLVAELEDEIRGLTIEEKREERDWYLKKGHFTHSVIIALLINEEILG